MTLHAIAIAQLTADYDLVVRLGGINNVQIIEKFGRNPDIDTAAAEDVWNGGGIYTGLPTGSAETMEIFSSDVNDTLAGTGARTATITFLLDGNLSEMPDITVALNGQTPVSLGSQTYLRATRIKVITAGSSGKNVGTLTLRHTSTTANIFAVLPIGKNQTTIAVWTVPSGKTLYIKTIDIGMARSLGADGSADVALLCRPFGEVFQVITNPEITNQFSYQYRGEYIEIPSKADIKVHVFSVSDNNTIVSAEFSGKLIG